MSLKVRFIGGFGKPTGYGVACNDYCLALHQQGVDLDIRPILPIDSSDLSDRYHCLLPLVNRQDADYSWPTHVISHTIAHYAHILVDAEHELCPPTAKKVAYTTWESDRLPKIAADPLRETFDAVLVPSKYNAQALIAGNVPKNKIHIVPHCFDPDWWFVAAPERNGKRPYTFYAIVTWCERKDPIGLLKAYLTTFTSKDDVILKISTPSWVPDDFAFLVRSIGLEDLPKVVISKDRLTDEQIRELHYTSDCYVTTTRAEGWGLGAFEAALAGNHVISTGYSGVRDFLDPYSNKQYLNYMLTPAITPETKTATVINVAGLEIRPLVHNEAQPCIFGDQLWAEPDLHGAQKAMRHAYKARYGRNTNNRSMLRSKFSYAAVGQQFKAVLEGL